MYRWIDRPVEDHERDLKGDLEDYKPEGIIVWLFAMILAGFCTLALLLVSL